MATSPTAVPKTWLGRVMVVGGQLDNTQLMGSVMRSLEIALYTAIAAVALGTLAAFVLTRISRFKGRTLFGGLVTAPLVMPEVITGLSLLLVNNSYLGLIRQAQRNFDMDYCVQLAFENINAPELDGYGVDHVAVVEGLGCKAIRVLDADDLPAAFTQAARWMEDYRVPVVVEVILERVTNIAMGTDIDKINEFEEQALHPSDAPTAITVQH